MNAEPDIARLARTIGDATHLSTLARATGGRALIAFGISWTRAS